MIDGCGREIDHLRLSLTDHCNLACRYCVPEGFQPSTSANTGIDPDFAFEAVRWLSQRHGIRHVRLTGGEPLLYQGLIPLLDRISRLNTLTEITLTTKPTPPRSREESERCCTQADIRNAHRRVSRTSQKGMLASFSRMAPLATANAK